MMRKIAQPKCSTCGRFISYESLQKGSAYYIMVLPDSAVSSETWEGLCCKCKEVEDARSA